MHAVKVNSPTLLTSLVFKSPDEFKLANDITQKMVDYFFREETIQELNLKENDPEVYKQMIPLKQLEEFVNTASLDPTVKQSLIIQINEAKENITNVTVLEAWDLKSQKLIKIEMRH